MHISAQMLSHLVLVLIVAAAVVILALTSHLTSADLGVVLAVAGFGHVGVAGVGASGSRTPPSS